MKQLSTQTKTRYWYQTFRTACYVSVFGVLVWTVVMVFPLAPLSEFPRIIVGVPGEWLIIAYVLYLSIGVGAFGWVSGLLTVIERQENREVSPSLMWPGFVMMFFGVTSSCVLLGYAGASGGYAALNGAPSTLQQMLLPYVDPITTTALVAVAGAAFVFLAMLRARGP